ncbi:hypothetical protein [Actinomycetospora sp. TBRC 11914]|uniref:bestrophin-like domain n=1 Tax=Actinomycetospora sp. TBRC 11914 TaxID=2729387 RepID=UPI00145C3A87|nr:hypothetical protein [Actinomycetospora sp. TBRC 11914]NMO88244.1 hypothetical protein [Actinomycetospora sp. TBRC 11914]
MVWLTSLPVGLLIGGCLLVAGLIAIASRLAARAFLLESQHDGAHAIAAPLMSSLGAGFAILAALTLANEAAALSDAESIVSNEAADASRLAWAATTPGVAADLVHTALLRYLEATRANEWRGQQAAAGNDPRTASAVADLERVVRTEAVRPGLSTPVSTELLASVDAITTDRRARLASAAKQLPGLYVITLVVGGIALIANAGVLTVRVHRRGALVISGLTIVIGLSVALILALHNPWDGSIVVSGYPLDSVINDLVHDYFHT